MVLDEKTPGFSVKIKFMVVEPPPSLIKPLKVEIHRSTVSTDGFCLISNFVPKISCFFDVFRPIVFLRKRLVRMFSLFPLSECDSNLQIPQNLVIVMDNAFVQCYQQVEKNFKWR